MLATLMAAQVSSRHNSPKATVAHPKGVIVPNDQLVTENIRDPDYTPYCGPCVTPVQRLHRVADGFVCPNCGNKTNWDLTPFNGNVDVKYDETVEGYGELPKPPEVLRDWKEDQGKKNTETKPCGRCKNSFFGIRKRKYCFDCQPAIDRLRGEIHAGKVRSPYDSRL